MESGRFDTSKAERLNNPQRIEELRPVQLLRDLAGIAEGMTCVDLGSGTGVFCLRMADLVGDSGVVYAVDSSAEMLAHIRAKSPPAGLKLLQADVARTGLAGEIADVCLLAFILHEVKAPESVVAEAHRLLKPGGRLVIVEWKVDVNRGPPREVRIRESWVRQVFGEVGLAFGEYLDWSPNHYVIVGTKPTVPHAKTPEHY